MWNFLTNNILNWNIDRIIDLSYFICDYVGYVIQNHHASIIRV
jgi:hypothetical protein